MLEGLPKPEVTMANVILGRQQGALRCSQFDSRHNSFQVLG
jgi:hypothetical protein